MLRTFLLAGLLQATLLVSAMDMTFIVRSETCDGVNGGVGVETVGGVSPYTYAWVGPNGFTAVGDTIFGLEAGTYTCTVTDNVGASISEDVVVADNQFLEGTNGGTYAGAMSVVGYWGGACVGECNGAMLFVDDWIDGVGPFTYDFDVPATLLGDDGSGHPVYGGFCLGETVHYSFFDQAGCLGVGTFVVYGVDESWYPVVQEVQGSCSAGEGGSIQVMPFSPMQTTMVLKLDGITIDTQYGYSGSPVYFTDLAPGTYDLLVEWQNTQCDYAVQVSVQDLGPLCNGVSGRSWYDGDGDCVQDGNEVGIPNSVLLVEPGGQYTITHADGSYALNLADGDYTIAQTDPTLVPICPASLPAPFTIASAPLTLDLASGSNEPLDLDIYAISSTPRPGFDYHVYGSFGNASPQVSGPVTLTCIFDPALTYGSALPEPSNVAANVITWDLPALTSFQGGAFNVTLNVPLGTPLGLQISSSVSVSNTLTEASLDNNTAVETRTVMGSYDPNEKEVRTSSQLSNTEYFVGTDTYLDYTIHFQNTGTDTAFTVVMTDTLETTLDMGTFQQGVASHRCIVDFLPGRVVQWTFTDILLPDSNTNEGASHGLTSFRIKPVAPVLPGLTITNAADIFFDFNAPVRTPDVVVVTETSTGIADPSPEALRVWPNPASGSVTVEGADLSRVVLMDLQGRVVMAVPVSVSNRVHLDVRSVGAGPYLLHTTDVQGGGRTVPLVVAR